MHGRPRSHTSPVTCQYMGIDLAGAWSYSDRSGTLGIDVAVGNPLPHIFHDHRPASTIHENYVPQAGVFGLIFVVESSKLLSFVSTAL